HSVLSIHHFRVQFSGTSIPGGNRSSITGSSPQQQPVCQRDIVFVMDDSQSINEDGATDPTNWERVTAFVSNVASQLTFGSDSVQAGIIEYSTDVNRILDLTFDQQEFVNTVLSIPYSGEATQTAGALREGTQMLNEQGRAGVQGVVVLVSDGEQNGPGNPFDAADELRAAGYELIIVAISAEEQANIDFFDELGAGQAPTYVATAADLDDVVDEISVAVCERGIPTPTPTQTANAVATATAGAGQTQTAETGATATAGAGQTQTAQTGDATPTATLTAGTGATATSTSVGNGDPTNTPEDGQSPELTVTPTTTPTLPPTAVELEHFWYRVTGPRTMTVEWVTSMELDTQHFRVMMAWDGENGYLSPISNPVVAQGRTDGFEYTINLELSEEPAPGFTLWLEETELNGSVLLYGPAVNVSDPASVVPDVYLPMVLR
ncbi:MAG: vWA domain-containing protein, partial [Patescibacteria group bacterium]